MDLDYNKLEMNIEKIITHFGSVAGLAEKLKVTPAAVYLWRYQGRIPVRRQYEIRELTKGAFRVEPPPK